MAVILNLVPMEPSIKATIVKIVIIAAIIVFVLWILQILGVQIPIARLP